MFLSIITLLMTSLVTGLIADSSCPNPVVESNTYTTTDGMVIASVAFVAEFSVTCNGERKDLTLYADVNGKTVPAMKSLDGSKYQVSWAEDSESVNSGDYFVRIYDDEGYAALRKAQRNAEDVSNVKPVFEIVINHGGTYLGPYMQSECMAVLLTVLLWYGAYTAKSKIQA